MRAEEKGGSGVFAVVAYGICRMRAMQTPGFRELCIVPPSTTSQVSAMALVSALQLSICIIYTLQKLLQMRHIGDGLSGSCYDFRRGTGLAGCVELGHTSVASTGLDEIMHLTD